MALRVASGTCANTRGAILGIPPSFGAVWGRGRYRARYRRHRLASVLLSRWSLVLGRRQRVFLGDKGGSFARYQRYEVRPVELPA